MLPKKSCDTLFVSKLAFSPPRFMACAIWNTGIEIHIKKRAEIHSGTMLVVACMINNIGDLMLQMLKLLKDFFLSNGKKSINCNIKYLDEFSLFLSNFFSNST